jgi:transmembrane sensor
MNSRNDHPRGPSPSQPPALDPVEDEALRWFLKLQSASDLEIQRGFEAWRARDRRNAAAFAKVTALWNSAELGEAVRRQQSADGIFSESGINPPNPSRPALRRPRTVPGHGGLSRRRVGAIAAILIAAIALAQISGLSTYVQADYVTGTGERRHVTLPDGSTMQLNSHSAVALDFDKGRRVVRLIEGEAFFEVLRDPDRPFRVSAQYADVEVTGTAFSVRTAAEESDIVLRHGHVSVLPKSSQAAVVLEPEQTVSVSAAGLGAVQSIDASDAFAWLGGRIRFHDRPLGRVIDELRRHHRGVIIIANDRIRHIRVSGNYRLDDPALVVASLAEAIGARLTRVSDFILVLR